MSDFILTSEGWRCENTVHRLPSPTYWCTHLKEFIEQGRDATHLNPGMVAVVPVFPNSAIFAQVHIKEEIFPGGAAPMELRHTPDIGREKVIPLGFWNPGEGMASMRSVIIDQLRSNLDPRESWTRGTVYTACPQRSHPMAYTSAIRNKATMEGDVDFRQALLWNIVMEGACTLCLKEAADPTGGNFGIDPNTVQNGRNPFA